jgi:multiple sugar transport system ATP-binding protein
MAELRLKNVTKRYGSFVGVDNFNLDIADQEFLVLLGPSGCGKTTTMRMIAGLEEVTEGEIWLGGRLINNLEPKDRDISMVFQSYGLYPNMTVYENIRFPLRVRKVSADQHRERVLRAARMVELTDLLDRRPAELSGGQRQRVALGRAIVREPNVFLMDEPLSNLDAKLRVHMRSELAELHARLGVTMVYVTHDQVEAMTMADRLAVMDQGVILQLGTPTEVYERPASVTVAQFIGSPAINLLPARVGANRVIELLDATLPLRVDAAPGSALSVGVRPEAVRLRGEPGDVPLPCRFRRRENLGAESILHFDLVTADGRSEPLPVLCKVGHDTGALAFPDDGLTILSVAPGSCHVFDASGSRLETDGAPARSSAPGERMRDAVGHIG